MGRLAGGIAHDFNNVLVAVLGFAELARQCATGTPEQREHLQQIVDAARRGAAFTRQILAFSRRNPVRSEAIDLVELVRRLTPMLARVLGDECSLEVAATTALPVVQADSGSLEQVLLNLLVNARDARPRSGVVRIGFTASRAAPGETGHGCVEMAIRDDGIGMAPDVLARACEPYFTTKPPGRGTGLGLAVCDGLVRQLGGRLTVESELGVGTCVRVRLPQAAPGSVVATPPSQRGDAALAARAVSASSPPPSPDASAGPGMPPPVVLVVDGAPRLRRDWAPTRSLVGRSARWSARLRQQRGRRDLDRDGLRIQPSSRTSGDNLRRLIQDQPYQVPSLPSPVSRWMKTSPTRGSASSATWTSSAMSWPCLAVEPAAMRMVASTCSFWPTKWARSLDTD
jgi:anti-sigma regulatory factor (Ser/Thr protein kinase)